MSRKKNVKENLQDTLESLCSDMNVIDMQAWFMENMPVGSFPPIAVRTVSSITGAIIGAWFDAGARPEQVKEYLSKFVDTAWATLYPEQTASADLF